MSNSTIRYCKKCGCELMSTNKHQTCENCRRKRMGKVKNGLKAIGAAALSFGVFMLNKGRKGPKGD